MMKRGSPESPIASEGGSPETPTVTKCGSSDLVSRTPLSTLRQLSNKNGMCVAIALATLLHAEIFGASCYETLL